MIPIKKCSFPFVEVLYYFFSFCGTVVSFSTGNQDIWFLGSTWYMSYKSTIYIAIVSSNQLSIKLNLSLKILKTISTSS